MPDTFYFYDLETSGFNPKDARIMQFAGQRTDMDLNPIGEPHNILIKMTDDIVPEPDAIMVTGITPQKTIQDGISESEFLKFFHEEIARPKTIFTGFNTVRFDDEFMRYLHYRNFYDPYEWQWTDGKSKWDLLDVVRMTRALRPEGIKWPVDSKGAPTNRLELLTALNGLDHTNAHDALSDVRASIDVAKLLRSKQPKLFDYLLKMRKKDEITALVSAQRPFVYTSGKYASEFEKTTVAALLTENPYRTGSFLVFDLRYDPEPFLKLDPPALAEAWRKRKDDPGPRLPVKTLQSNRCPAIAPLGVLDEDSRKRLQISQKEYEKHYEQLRQYRQQLSKQVLAALELMDKKQQARLLEDESEVDAKLYDGFFMPADKSQMNIVRSAEPKTLAELSPGFNDQRLAALLPLYKARNFPESMSDSDRQAWEVYRKRRLLGGGNASRLARFFARLGELSEQKDMTGEKRYLLEELQLYGQSIMPEEY